MNGASHILVVEDHGALGRFIAAALTQGGWAVIGPISSPAAAIDAIGQSRFALAIIDCVLRGEEAFAVADAVLARGAQLLFISGYARSTLPQRFRDLPFLEKPFTLQALLDAVEIILAPK